MTMHLIQQIEKELGKKSLPKCEVGDTVEVHYLIREGEKERVQLFIGTVIALKGRGIRRSITVRRIVQGEGVERVFPLHNPRVKDVVTTRKGETRRAKLYFLRDRVGKATKLKEVLGERGGSDTDNEPAGSAPALPSGETRRHPEPVGAR
jgi:large subunit ribosomal protein L19